MLKNNNTNDQEHQKSHQWLYSPFNRMGEGHSVTIEDKGDSVDLRTKAEGRPPVASVGNRGGVEEQAVAKMQWQFKITRKIKSWKARERDRDRDREGE